MPHVDESKRMKLFGDFTILANRDGQFVDRRGRRVVGGDDIAQPPETSATDTTSPAPPPRTLTTAPPDDAAELCYTCPASGSCPAYCRTCGGGVTIVGPCPIGRW